MCAWETEIGIRMNLIIMDNFQWQHMREKNIEIEADNREPYVLWHEMSQTYIMLFWNAGFDFAFLRSTDFLNWEETQRITLPER